MRSEGNVSLKNPVTSSGVDPGTVQLVAQRLNHYATPGRKLISSVKNLSNMEKKIGGSNEDFKGLRESKH